MFNSVLRYYDEAVIEYFNDIEIHDGVEFRTPQIQFSIPSANGYKLKKDSENNTALMPLIVITRSGIVPNNVTNMIKNSVTRPKILDLNPSSLLYDGIDVIYYGLQYKVAFFSMTREMHNTILEQMIFKLHREHSIRAHVEVLNHAIKTDNYLSDVSINDTMNYDLIDNATERIFTGDVSFTMNAKLFKAQRNISSVLIVKEEANTDSSEVVIEKETISEN